MSEITKRGIAQGRVNMDGATRRQISNRRAQEKYRLKQAEYVASVESRAEELASFAARLQLRVRTLEALLEASSTSAGVSEDASLYGRVGLDVVPARATAEPHEAVNSHDLNIDKCVNCALLQAEIAHMKRKLKLSLGSKSRELTFTHPLEALVIRTPTQMPESLSELAPLYDAIVIPSDSCMPLMPSNAPSESLENAGTSNLHSAQYAADPSPMDAWVDEANSAVTDSVSDPVKGTHQPRVLSGARIRSATDLFGPPQIEFARIWMKELPSLRDCHYVDFLMDTFIAQAKSRNPTTIEKHGVQLVSLWQKMVLSCSPDDRSALFEIDQILNELNKQYISYAQSVCLSSDGWKRYQHLKWTLPVPEGDHLERGIQTVHILQKELLCIPSLSSNSAANYVQELCTLFIAGYTGDSDLFKLLACFRHVQERCVGSGERLACMHALVRWIEGNRAFGVLAFDELLTRMDHMSLTES